MGGVPGSSNFFHKSVDCRRPLCYRLDMAYCEDYPCCGHEAGGCPRTNDDGEQVFPCASCGCDLPVHNRSALCDSCLNAGDPDDPDYGCDCDDCECDEPADMSDVEADADTLASAGYGTDEDYGYFGEMGCNED